MGLHWLAFFMLMQIMRNAAEPLIPVTLELGGKDPFIVCEDVDVSHVRISLIFLCQVGLNVLF